VLWRLASDIVETVGLSSTEIPAVRRKHVAAAAILWR
jgi:hypothetical protein